MKTNKYIAILIYAAIFSNARFFLADTSGIVSYVLATLILLTAILIAKETGELLASGLGLNVTLNTLTNLALLGGSVMLSFAFIETVLQISARFFTPERQAPFLHTLTMPAGWERRPVHIAGTQHAYYWHNVLHIHNADNMRLPGEFPGKKAGTFRIIALGDSLTYGYGIAEQHTYPGVLEEELSRSFRVEVLNLGVSGAQTEDIYSILTKHLPVLEPDLVFYGVCLNDFLPSRVGQYQNNRAYQVPLPYKEHFIQRTLTGRLLAKQYDALLMRWGLRVDFLTDILRDFAGYQARFARDVKAMNAFVREHGLPPMITMVLDQYPNTKAKGYEVVLAAEKHLRNAGMRVIPSDYIKRNDGRTDWYVSRWEGHPNEKANSAFAQEIAKVLADLPELRPYRRSNADGGGIAKHITQLPHKPRNQKRGSAAPASGSDAAPPSR